MTRPKGLVGRAGLALAASQVLVLAAAGLGGGSGLLVAGPAAALALVLVGLWWKRADVRLLYATAVAGAIALLAPIEQPLEPLEVVLALASALALVAFLEYGHLAHRVEGLSLDEDGDGGGSVLDAMRSRLTRAITWTALGTAAVVGLTAVPGPWLSDAFARSVERQGPVGILLVGGAVATLTVSVARLRQYLAEREEAEQAGE